MQPRARSSLWVQHALPASLQPLDIWYVATPGNANDVDVAAFPCSTPQPMTTFVTCTNCGQRWKFC